MDAYRDIDGELRAMLAGQETVESYLTLQVLKESESETTELVVPSESINACGSDGPPAVTELLFVRKRIRLQGGAGSAYETLFAAQQAGAPLPHTPRIEACARVGGELTVVMEHVSGLTLGEYVAAHGAGERRVRELAAPLCDAVSELHERLDPPLIHRDLKPSNIIISDGRGGRASGEPVIIDFGIARTWRDGAETDTQHLGTRGYAAPEQFGFGQTDERSDVYALGMLLFFCCTGEQPQAGLDADALAAAGVPRSLAVVILRATAFDPAARYQSAAALKAAFEESLNPWIRMSVPAAAAHGNPTKGGSDAVARGTRKRQDGSAPGSASSASSLLQRLSGALGRVWNAIVVAVWLFFMVTLVICVADPFGVSGEYPLWYAVCLYGGIGMTGFSAAAWLLYDKRRLRKKYLEPWGLTRGHEWAIFFVLVALCVFFFLFLCIAEALRDALLS